MLKSVKQIKDFERVIYKYLTVSSDGAWDSGATKFDYAVKKLVSRLSWADKYNEALSDINIDNAQTDEKGSLLRNEKGEYLYTKEGEKARIAAIKSLDDKVQIEFEPYYPTEPPLKPFSDEDVEVLKGFVIEP